MIPARCYKNVNELQLNENIKLSKVDLNYFSETDECVHASTNGSQVVDFYEGKSIFITGATGFLGKLLLEKLLRSCRNIGTIYVLLRSKRNKSPFERMKTTLDDIIFSELIKVQPNFQEKVKTIEGDISLPNLGMSEHDQELFWNEVNVIFHVAANIKIEEKLRIMATCNIGGTLELLKLAKKCQNLSSLVYVSTAYSNFPREHIGEEIYEPPSTAEDILNMVDKYGTKLDDMEKQLLGEWPNAYVFSKVIAEDTVKRYGNGLPTCILRPSLVSSTYKEPLKSWVNNYTGCVGIIINSFVGILRCFYSDPTTITDIVPADYVVNAIIVAAYNNQFNRNGEIKVYNYVSYNENPITCGDYHDIANFYGRQAPTLRCLWYPSSVLEKNYYLYLFGVVFYQFIPALLFDGALTITGQKRWLFSLVKKIYEFNRVTAIVGFRHWRYTNDNVQEMWRKISDVDKKIFNFSLSKENFDWNEYLSTLSMGMRTYFLKDDLETIPEALKMHNRLYFYHMCLKATFNSILLLLAAWIVRSTFFKSKL